MSRMINFLLKDACGRHFAQRSSRFRLFTQLHYCYENLATSFSSMFSFLDCYENYVRSTSQYYW